MININEFIRLRKACKLTQKALAKKASAGAQQLISQIERGEVRTTKKIYRIAAVLGVDAHQLDPDLPEHPLAPFAAALVEMDPADSEWVLNRFRRDIEHVQRKPLAKMGAKKPTKPPSRGDGHHKRPERPN